MFLSSSLFFLALGSICEASVRPDLTVKVKNGTYVGTHSRGYNQDFFLGVPYAQAPQGDLRLRNPQSLNTTFRTKQAKEYYPSCVGYGSDNWGYPYSEDCLALNIVRPAGTKKHSKLPVVVWIHGGGYYQGGGGDKRYNTSALVQNSVEIHKPIIAITINYRLAQWGFLSGDEVLEAGTTNLGFKDQRLALHWINENIHAFGGDPCKVTISGESAGGGSVVHQAALYGGRDDKLFRAVISQSTYINANFANRTHSQVNFENVTAAAGCTIDRLNCLRKLPFEEINRVFNSTTSGAIFGPVIDGDLLQELNTKQINAGRFVKVPLLLGANTDEGTSFGMRGINTTEQMAVYISSTGPDANATAELLRLYPDDPSQGVPVATYLNRPPPGSPLGQQYKRSSVYGGDYVMHSLRRQYNQVWTANGVKNYAYRFNARSNGLVDSSGVPHFQDVAFVFDNTLNLGYGEPISAKPFENRGPAYFELADLMSKMWVSFIHDLDPNNHGVRGANKWPEYSSTENFVFDANVTSFAEPDTYRSDGIQYIIDNSVEQFNR